MRARVTRDTALLVGGMAGMAYEVAYDNQARPLIIYALLAMMGLPVLLNADERKNRHRRPDPEPPKRRPPAKKPPRSGTR
jgi:hypothetical protein